MSSPTRTSARTSLRRPLLSLSLSILLPLFCVASVSSAAAAPTDGVGWRLQTVAEPSVFHVSSSELLTKDEFVVVAENVGDRPVEGKVTVTVALPPGVTTAGGGEAEEWSCAGAPAGLTEVTCTSEAGDPAQHAMRQIAIPVTVPAAPALPLVGETHISGGVAECGEPGHPACPQASAGLTARFEEATPSFAPEQFSAALLSGDGQLFTQAAGHPGAATTAVMFPSALEIVGRGPYAKPVQELDQIVIELPPGVVGDLRSVPACPLANVNSVAYDPTACPTASHIGSLVLFEPGAEGSNQTRSTLYNVVPEYGYPAEIGVYLPNVQRTVALYATLGPAPNYQVRLISSPADRFVRIDGITSTVFGDPAATDASGLTPSALFTAPSDCSAAGFTTTVHVDSWQQPGRFNPDGSPDFTDPNWRTASSTSPPVTGCAQLQFHPSLSAQPTTTSPDSPTGLNVELKFPQDEDAGGLATPPLKDSTVTLPRGVVLSPSQANGLQACSNEQIDLATNDPATCPAASQIATVTAHTPILEESLPGQVFLGTPECSPCTNQDAQDGKLARLFIQIHSERYGVTLKIPGTASINPATGQVTATFDNLPQQPVEDLKVVFPEGPRAALSTPSCGKYTTTSDLTPWSSPQTPDATPPSSFTLSSCASNAFGPAFTAGMTSTLHAGDYSPFTLTFSRNDGEQDFGDVEQTLPPGMLAKLAGVQQCGNAEAATGNCPAGSRIGSVTAGAGPGSDPFYTSGSIYLTGPYNGGAFGEVVVVQAVAGPFNLGTVVVRGSIRINPTTAQATVVSDPFPSMLAGIPLQIRTINVNLKRAGFTFNSTNCTPAAVTGKLVSTQGTGANVSYPYEPTNCATLPFKPVLTASTGGRASKAGGATLDVKIASKGGPGTAGEEANIKSVKVDLPIQLPSRLSTLQKACLAATFEANPANCPSASDVGTATAVTPLLSAPLSGPAYLVSHGGEAFPDLEIVLQGEGVKLVLVGNTQIKKGITSSTFKTVPDAPISSFELKLPTGKTSILGANVPEKDKYVLCGQSLPMPTAITGQNGGIVKQTTKIGITNCAKAKKKTKAKQVRRASVRQSNRRSN